MGRKKKKKVVKIEKPKLPANETYWLAVTKSKKDILAFAEKGNQEQKQNLRNSIDYRLWQIHQGEIEGDFFTKNDIDLKSIDIDVKKQPKRNYTKKKEIHNGDPISPEEKTIHKKVMKETKKVIDLFDFANITEE